MQAARLNPTIFDKLAADTRLPGLGGADGKAEAPRAPTVYEFANLERFTEESLRTNVRRELSWLMNTTNLESSVDLSRFPQIRTSVLNYGVADLTGKSQSRTTIVARAAKLREAIVAFEPRIAPNSVAVEAYSTLERENSVSFVINADITAAVEALNVRFVTDIEVDTGNVTVRE